MNKFKSLFRTFVADPFGGYFVAVERPRPFVPGLFLLPAWARPAQPGYANPDYERWAERNKGA